MIRNRFVVSIYAAVAIATSLSVIGCGGQRGPDYSVLKLAQVEGKVTLDGEPLPGVRVEFVEANNQPPRLCFGETDSAGNYQIYRDRNVPGCLPGEMIVRISGSSGLEDGPMEEGAESTKVPARYNSKSELRETVEPNSSHTFDFALTSE